MKKLVLAASMLLAVPSISPALAYANSNAPGVTVSIINGQGETIGKAELAQKDGKLFMHLEAEKLPPGKHGIHFHTEGKCDTPDFSSAGGHFNPFEKQHGFNNPKGYHSGDLPNIEVGADGKVAVDLFTADASLLQGKANSLLKQGGTALVIHEKEDDYVTDPSGNSGNRIACGVIK
jgi:Cu-Zn family superoxide dismutase